jgi:hypothetical protein
MSHFKVQKQLPEKHGALTKKGKFMGKLLTRYYKIGWQDKHAVLHYFSNASMSSQGKVISLQQYVS